MNITERQSRKSDVGSHRAGKVAHAVEKQTTKLPSDLFLWAAVGSIVASLGAQVIGVRRGVRDAFLPKRAPLATFIGMWAPTFLLLGIYNEIAKVAGSSDRAER
jgi:hypothetical protein